MQNCAFTALIQQILLLDAALDTRQVRVRYLNKTTYMYITSVAADETKHKKLKNLEIIYTTKLLAQVIDNLHNGKSVTALWHPDRK